MTNSEKSEVIFLVEEQNLEKLKEIYTNDKDFNFSFTNDEGKTLLHIASEKQNGKTLLIIQWLLDRGIDPNSVDENFQTALEIAKKRNNIPALTIMKHNINLKENEMQKWK